MPMVASALNSPRGSTYRSRARRTPAARDLLALAGTILSCVCGALSWGLMVHQHFMHSISVVLEVSAVANEILYSVKEWLQSQARSWMSFDGSSPKSYAELAQ